MAGDPGAAAAAEASLSFARDWDYLREVPMTQPGLLIVGGTLGIGKEIAQRDAGQGWSVVLTSRDDSTAKSVANELGGNTRGLALDLSEPELVADALADVGAIDHLVLAAIARDTNTLDDYDIASARNLVIMKLVGYTAVVSAMRDRLAEDGSIVLFGGRAKDRPYPGGMTVGTVNAGISGMVPGLHVAVTSPGECDPSGHCCRRSILVRAARVHRAGPTGDAYRAQCSDGGHSRRGRLLDPQPVGQRDRPVHRRWLAAAAESGTDRCRPHGARWVFGSLRRATTSWCSAERGRVVKTSLGVPARVADTARDAAASAEIAWSLLPTMLR